MPRSPLSRTGRGAAGAATLLALTVPSPLAAQEPEAPPVDSTTTIRCESCAEWNAPQRPFRVYGNTYYVGTHGLAAVLVTSPEGHVLIDGGLPQSAPRILENIRALGFRPEDVRLILNSHAHFDHAGGIAALQRATGAVVAASPRSAPVLERGASGPDDPQYGALPAFPQVREVHVISDGEPLTVGPLTLTAHFTAGHTPGGTSWSWRSCEESRCLDLVYADSQTPVSADGFYFTRSRTYPWALSDFEHGFQVLERLPCDILLTPHPAASRLWERVAARKAGNADALVDPGACRAYAAAARDQLAVRLEREAAEADEQGKPEEQ
jgi:metallo-beta-lactamase class B